MCYVCVCVCIFFLMSIVANQYKFMCYTFVELWFYHWTLSVNIIIIVGIPNTTSFYLIYFTIWPCNRSTHIYIWPHLVWTIKTYFTMPVGDFPGKKLVTMTFYSWILSEFMVWHFILCLCLLELQLIEFDIFENWCENIVVINEKKMMQKNKSLYQT